MPLSRTVGTLVAGRGLTGSGVSWMVGRRLTGEHNVLRDVAQLAVRSLARYCEKRESRLVGHLVGRHGDPDGRADDAASLECCLEVMDLSFQLANTLLLVSYQGFELGRVR